MLNTPNEWHNEEDIEEYTDEDFSDDYSGDYGEDTDFGSLDDADFEDSEYEEDAEESENGGGDNSNGDNDSKKKIIIGIAIILVLLLLVGGVVGLIKQKNQKSQTAVETVVTDDTEGQNTIEVGDETSENSSDEIDISIEDDSDDINIEGENTEEVGIAVAEKDTKAIEAEEASGLEIEADESTSAFADSPNDTKNVTVSIGDVGRKNPFARSDISETKVSSTHKINNDGLDFEVIEPPELEPEDEMITRLLETKVSGIMYDSRRPSAIINIDGVDQLVRIGDILSGFEFLSITKNKVVIRSDSNIYRASVGQPLNAERITNPVEISNLETKFKGSQNR